MEEILGKISHLDRQLFYSSISWLERNPSLYRLADWLAFFGVILVILSLIYLVSRNRIHALFTAVLAVIFSSFIYCLLYLLWQSPDTLITYAAESSHLTGNLPDLRFPSGQVYMSFSIMTAVILRGHRRLGVLLAILAMAIAMSRISLGTIYPSGAITSIIIGVISGILAFWFMEYFEDFWRNNSA